MGAWGSGAFENDGALDWLGELRGVASLRRTLGKAEKGRRALEVDDASAVIAAAELVAAARGHGARGLPQEATEWLAAHAGRVTAADARLAKQAVGHVLAASELQELWEEAGGRADDPWRRSVGRLQARLTRPARKRVARRRVRASPPSPEIKHAPSVRSPNGKLTAEVWTDGEAVTVWIAVKDGGGSVTHIEGVPLEAVTVGWIDDATLEVRYPAGAKFGWKKVRDWFHRPYAVRCRYRARRTR